jgi:hypothetical protein
MIKILVLSSLRYWDRVCKREQFRSHSVISAQRERSEKGAWGPRGESVGTEDKEGIRKNGLLS